MNKVKRVAHLVAGGTPDVGTPQNWSDDNLPWVTIAEMTRERTISTTSRHVSEIGRRSKNLPVGEPGTVLFAMYASVGETAELAVRASWNQAILGLTPRSGMCDPRFLRYWLRHAAEDALSQARGSTQVNLSAEQVANFYFPGLTPDEQRRIAAFLDDQVTRIDQVIHLRKQHIALLKERFRSLVTEHVTGAPPAGAGVVGGNHAKLWGTSKWPLTPVGSVVSLENGYPFPSEDFRSEGATPLVRIRDLLANEFSIFLSETPSPQWLLQNDDIVIGMDGDFNVVRWNRGQAALNQRLCRLRPKAGADIRFVAYALPSNLTWINATRQATTVKHLSSTEILKARIPLPTAKEQERIADFLDAQYAINSNLIAAEERQIALLQERKRSLITAAVTGEFDVSSASARAASAVVGGDGA